MKKNNKSNVIKGTLDYHHKQKMLQFDAAFRKINQNMLKIQDKLLSTCKIKSPVKYHKLNTKLTELKKEKQKKQDEHKQYFLNVMDLLSEYYYANNSNNWPHFNGNNNNRLSNNVCSTTNNDITNNSSNNINNNSSNIINNNTNHNTNNNTSNKPYQTNNDDLTVFIEKTTKINKTNIFNEYMFRLTNDAKNKKITYVDLCKVCDQCQTKLTVDTLKSKYVCENCGQCYFALLEHDKTVYVKHPVIEMNTFSYRRYDHFVEWLNKFHNVDKSKVPKKIYVLINKELKKQHKKNNEVTEENILEILKKTQNTKYNCQVSQILNILNEKKLPTLPTNIQHQMKSMFKQTLQPFTEICPQDRTNFLSYSYVIRKFLEILKQYEYIDYFPLLKSKEKLYQQDLIWKAICNKLKWTFYPTI